MLASADTEDAWPGHTAGLAEEEMPGMPALDVAKLDGHKTNSSSGEFVPEYSHKSCTTVTPLDEW